MEALKIEFKDVAIVEVPRYNEAKEYLNSGNDKQNGGPGSGRKGHRTPKNNRYTAGKLGKYKDLKELSQEAKEYYKKHIQGKNIDHKELGKIGFSRAGLKKLLGIKDADVLKNVPKLPKIVEKGKLDKESSSFKDRKDKANRFYKLITEDKNKEYFSHIRGRIEGKNAKEIKDFYTMFIKNKKD